MTVVTNNVGLLAQQGSVYILGMVVSTGQGNGRGYQGMDAVGGLWDIPGDRKFRVCLEVFFFFF